jgi:hypothetical protein
VIFHRQDPLEVCKFLCFHGCECSEATLTKKAASSSGKLIYVSCIRPHLVLYASLLIFIYYQYITTVFVQNWRIFILVSYKVGEPVPTKIKFVPEMLYRRILSAHH